MYKKGSTETMSFLIGVIIFIMIVVPIGFAVYHYMQSKQGMEKTLTLLVERTSELEDGQKGNVIGYIETDYILLGFEKDKSYFGSGSGDYYWECQANVGLGSDTLSFVRDIIKPGKCGKRACLCACPVTGSFQTVGYFGAGSCQDSSTVCEVYEEDENPRFYGGADCEYGPFITHSVPTMEISFERQGQTIGICEEPPCISNGLNSARDVFKRFHEAYKKCDDYEVNDCICEAVNGEALPSDHYIIFKNDGAKTDMALHDTDGPTRATALIEDTLMASYNAGKDEAKLITTADISQFGYETPSGYNFAFLKEDSQLLYRTKEGYVGFVEEGEGIKAVKADKEYCRIKAGAAAEQGEEGSICRMDIPESSFDKARKELFGSEGAPDKITGSCRLTCSENEYEIGRRGDYCKTLRCCTPEPDAKCREAGGACQAKQCNPDDFQLPIEGITCPDDKKYCCKDIVGPCARLGGVCKHPCGENEVDKGGQTDCTIDNDVCCISSISEPVPLGA